MGLEPFTRLASPEGLDAADSILVIEGQDVPVYRAGQGMPLYPKGDPRNDAWDAAAEQPSALTAMTRATEETR